MPQYCFSINNYLEALKVISASKKIKKTPILYVKYNIINGFGINWIKELKSLINLKYKQNEYKIYIDSKNNYGLFIGLVELKINYLKIKSDKQIFIKLNQIAKINKVSVNPKFSIVDLKKIKNIELKVIKTYE